MRRFGSTALSAAVALSASVLAVAGGVMVAAPAVAEPALVPLSQNLRRCDFSEIAYVGGGYYGRATVLVRNEDGQVMGDVALVTGVPNTRYDVRLIQLPRSSAQRCAGGDPGVSETVMMTDGVGAGSVTVRAPIMSGATGVWFSITRPNPLSQTPEEFYTTDFVKAV